VAGNAHEYEASTCVLCGERVNGRGQHGVAGTEQAVRADSLTYEHVAFEWQRRVAYGMDPITGAPAPIGST
jgi:hypothetical protein